MQIPVTNRKKIAAQFDTFDAALLAQRDIYDAEPSLVGRVNVERVRGHIVLVASYGDYISRQCEAVKPYINNAT